MIWSSTATALGMYMPLPSRKRVARAMLDLPLPECPYRKIDLRELSAGPSSFRVCSGSTRWASESPTFSLVAKPSGRPWRMTARLYCASGTGAGPT